MKLVAIIVLALLATVYPASVASADTCAGLSSGSSCLGAAFEVGTSSGPSVEACVGDSDTGSGISCNDGVSYAGFVGTTPGVHDTEHKVCLHVGSALDCDNGSVRVYYWVVQGEIEICDPWGCSLFPFSV